MEVGPNLYAYVRQNPWTSFDPHGLFEWDQFGRDVGQSFVDLGKGVGGAVKSMNDGLNQAAYHPLATTKTIANTVKSDVVNLATRPGETLQVTGAHYSNVAKEKLLTSRGHGELLVEGGVLGKGLQVLAKTKSLTRTSGATPLVVKSARRGAEEMEAAIISLEQKGVYPSPTQRPLDTGKILEFANKMENGQWDEALNWSESHRPAVMQNPDGTQTIANGHHRIIAEQIAQQRGADFTLQKETLSSTTNHFKGDWKDVERIPKPKSNE